MTGMEVMLLNCLLPFLMAITMLALCGKRKNKSGATTAGVREIEGQQTVAKTKTEGKPVATDDSAKPKPPAARGVMAGTHDPNYQTLAVVGGGECFGADKKAEGADRGPKAPVAVGVMAGTHDPNYQTLAGIGGDCFGQDKKGGGAGPKAPNNPGAKAAIHDPNYQTLAGIGGNECFGNDKKK